VTIQPASDRSLLVSFGDEISIGAHHQVSRLTRALEDQRGVLNLHPAFASVLIDFDPRFHIHADIEALARQRLATATGETREPRLVEIPVCYGGEFGPDLEDVARHTGLTPERVVELHAAADYLVYFVGFATCFPYLGGLPPELATPRLPAPRKNVPAGSVAIGGSQAGIYPLASPGGWRIVGRTPLALFDPQSSPPPLLRMGDRVRFVPTCGAGLYPAHRFSTGAGGPVYKRSGRVANPPQVLNLPHRPADPLSEHIRVLSPGLQTTIQDLGRFGYAHFGVSASGAADPLALRAGNLLVGNAENAAALEMTLVGASLEFETDAVIALTGSDFGAALPLWTALEIKAGQTVRCGPTRSGARAYLAVRGGIGVPKAMGSASVHIMTGVGGRPLRAGDMLPIGDAAIRRPRTGPRRAPDFARTGPLRVTPGPQAHWFSDELYAAAYQVAEESNRMGIRLRGPAIPSPAGHMLTEGVPLGAIQVPPDGQPIILFVEHQTTGGYPKPANVISADFWRLGQLRPRDEVRFEPVTLDQALDLLRRQEQWLYALV
jgi:KipI family sensor histidine kinase inhibitor